MFVALPYPVVSTVIAARESTKRITLAVVCRLRNYVFDVLRELLKITEELHEHTHIGAAAILIKYLCRRQAVRSIDLPKDRCHGALSDHHRRVLCVDLCVCAGGYAYSNTFVGTTTFACGRPPLTCWSAWCTGAAPVQRSGFAGSACSWLMLPCAHDSGPDSK